MPAPTLDELLEQFSESLTSSVTSVRHGDKAVTYKSVSEMREAIRTVRELEDGSLTRVVANPQRPKL